jgi:hypothetical protein
LSAVPEMRRARHFLDHDLADTDRIARKASQLKVTDPSLSDMVKKASVRLDKMRAVLEDLYRSIPGTERSRVPRSRRFGQSYSARGSR